MNLIKITEEKRLEISSRFHEIIIDVFCKECSLKCIIKMNTSKLTKSKIELSVGHSEVKKNQELTKMNQKWNYFILQNFWI